jgi:hypothetical protein
VNDGGPYGLCRQHARAILNRCAASLSNIIKTPVPKPPIPGCLDGNEGHPASRFASAFGAAGSHTGALKDGNEIIGAAPRKAEGGFHTLVASDCAGAAPVLINSFHAPTPNYEAQQDHA